MGGQSSKRDEDKDGDDDDEKENDSDSDDSNDDDENEDAEKSGFLVRVIQSNGRSISMRIFNGQKHGMPDAFRMLAAVYDRENYPIKEIRIEAVIFSAKYDTGHRSIYRNNEFSFEEGLLKTTPDLFIDAADIYKPEKKIYVEVYFKWRYATPMQMTIAAGKLSNLLNRFNISVKDFAIGTNLAIKNSIVRHLNLHASSHLFEHGDNYYYKYDNGSETPEQQQQQ